ncbi:MAG TPA: diguanylate cyclase [Streptosporangiaceae bacterium]|nr:diguanylate cyclase [Streptosporangiaceae bacterium]
MSDTQAAELLAQLARRITASLDLRETLQVVAQAVVDQLGFGAAVVNLCQPGNMCEVAAVAGPDEVGRALLGTRAPMESFHRLLAGCEPWGELRFLDHRHDNGLSRGVAVWSPPGPPSEEPDAWHPEDMLLAPLYAPDQTLIGVLSVDIPADGRRPNLARRRLLEQFAAHAALAIEHSRVHTLVADSELLFRTMFDCSPIAIALMTETHEITRVNEACERLLGRNAADLVGRPAEQLTPDDAENEGDQYEVHFNRPDGSEVWGRVNRTSLAAGIRNGDQRLVLTQIEDITLLRTMQAQFAHAATHDKLTGLPNRALVLDRLTEVLVDAEKSGRRVAVLYCDVDHFKEINDTLGHAAGDQLLTEIGRNLASTARHRDIVGRFGGDEFVLVAYPMPSEAKATALADRVMRTVRRPVELSGEPVVASLSIGVALSGRDDTADSLLAAADQALYTAKASGRGRWQLAGQLPPRVADGHGMAPARGSTGWRRGPGVSRRASGARRGCPTGSRGRR